MSSSSARDLSRSGWRLRVGVTDLLLPSVVVLSMVSFAGGIGPAIFHTCSM
jgi:hypothetical protein